MTKLFFLLAKKPGVFCQVQYSPESPLNFCPIYFFFFFQLKKFAQTNAGTYMGTKYLAKWILVVLLRRDCQTHTSLCTKDSLGPTYVGRFFRSFLCLTLLPIQVHTFARSKKLTFGRTIFALPLFPFFLGKPKPFSPSFNLLWERKRRRKSKKRRGARTIILQAASTN